MKTIHIQIASYRDDELIKTIKSCLSQAAQPERLNFAIYHQYDDETRNQLSEYVNDKRFTVKSLSWREARGVGVARRFCNDAYLGQDFYLQIDSHMRFTEDWDELLINEWERCGDSLAILSSYPPAYVYEPSGTEKLFRAKPNRLVVDDIFMSDIPTFYGKGLPEDHRQNPQRALFASGGFQFGPGDVCKKSPYESEISFMGEEIVHSLRLFVAGFHIFTPIEQPIHHLYTRSENQKNPHHLWKDFGADDELRSVYDEMTKKSYAKVRQYLHGDVYEPKIIEEFESFCGVDIRNKKVHPLTYEITPMPLDLPENWRAECIEPVKYGEI